MGIRLLPEHKLAFGTYTKRENSKHEYIFKPEEIMKNRLLSGQVLARESYLISKNGKYHLTMQDDGNLVLSAHLDIDTREEVWSTKTAGIAISQCIMETNGNFALYKHNREIAFQTRTSNKPGAYLLLRDDGVIDLLQPQRIWSTHKG